MVQALEETAAKARGLSEAVGSTGAGGASLQALAGLLEGIAHAEAACIKRGLALALLACNDLNPSGSMPADEIAGLKALLKVAQDA